MRGGGRCVFPFSPPPLPDKVVIPLFLSNFLLFIASFTSRYGSNKLYCSLNHMQFYGCKEEKRANGRILFDCQLFYKLERVGVIIKSLWWENKVNCIEF